MKTAKNKTVTIGGTTFLTTLGFAELLKVKPITVYRMVTRHEIKVTKMFGMNLFLPEYFDEYVQARTQEAVV